MKISFVSTIFKSELTISDFLRELVSEIPFIVPAGYDYEIIIVDDKSPDNSSQYVREFLNENKKVRLISLTRNFGHHAALLCGIESASGDYVVLIDSDLEEDVKDIKRLFTELISNEEVQMVYGVQTTRKGGFIERLTGQLFYILGNILNEERMEPNQCTLRVFTRKYAKSVLRFKNSNLTLAGIFSKCGYTTIPIKLTKRSTSNTSYTLRKKINLAFMGIDTSSTRITLIVICLGFFTLIATVFFGILTLLTLLKTGFNSGWASLIFSIWLLGFIQIAILGLLSLGLQQVSKNLNAGPKYEIDEEYSS